MVQNDLAELSFVDVNINSILLRNIESLYILSSGSFSNISELRLDSLPALRSLFMRESNINLIELVGLPNLHTVDLFNNNLTNFYFNGASFNFCVSFEGGTA